MMKRSSCKTATPTVKSNSGGTVSPVVRLQPVKNFKPSWKRFMSNWHLDKRVPISLIVMIAVQSASAVWWASSVEAKMAEQQRGTDVMFNYMNKQTENDKRTIEILARLDERVKQQSETLATIERKVNK